MTQIELELQRLKGEVIDMWELVLRQLYKTQKALKDFDLDLAREVMIKEKRVNGYELKIDRDCENIFALYAPVAVDLRFVLAVLKINSNLERIGDLAESIAHYTIKTENIFSEKILKASQVLLMFEIAISIIEDSIQAFRLENTHLARSIFQRDEALNKINQDAIPFTKSYIAAHSDEIDQALHLLSVIRKIERVGDHAKNIAEETIFYIEAKVLKHNRDKANP